MGRAKALYKNRPQAIVYMVQRGCSIQAVDQRGYNAFDPADMRSVVQAIAQLVRDLRAAGALGPLVPDVPAPKPPSIEAIAANVPSALKEICWRLSEQPVGSMDNARFGHVLRYEMNMTQQEANFASRDVRAYGLVTFTNFGTWMLTQLGWDLVRFESTTRPKPSPVPSPTSPTRPRNLRTLR